jgi:hypothetical protein
MRVSRVMISLLLVAALIGFKADTARSLPSVVVPTPTLVLIASSAPQPASGIITVTVAVTGESNLGAFEFDLSYNHA